MPPANRTKEPKVKKKPGRRPTSCAECRRLKLKCDRQVPCEKCVSRGCGPICPEGCLEPSRGNRMVLSGTQELHDRIDNLCARIHELEAALRSLQGQLSDEPHPLLQNDIGALQPCPALKEDSPITPLPTARSEYSLVDSPLASPGSPDIGPQPRTTTTPSENDNDTDSFGTLIVYEDGASKFLGSTARAELLMGLTGSSIGRPDTHSDRNAVSREGLLKRLPPMSEASRLCEIYLRNSHALYAPLSRTELFDDVLRTAYYGAGYSFQIYHDAAFLFVTFALACYFDGQHPTNGDGYYQLARIALNNAPPARYTTLIAIQTMINLAQYQDLSDWDSAGSTSGWLDIGQAVRFGYSIGLHLDPSRWELPHHNVEKRKHVFWQLFVADTWSSFYLGRPPGISSSYIDTPLPNPESALVGLDGGTPGTFQAWCYGYTKLLNSVMAAGMSPTPMPYSSILDLDRRIRDYAVPIMWKLERNRSPVTQDTHFHRWFVLASKETTLLNLHRPYFAQALCERADESDLHDHRYIASIVAIYRSSWRIIAGLEWTWEVAPNTIQRANLPWSQALSAAIVLCLLITRAPTSHLVAPALEILRKLYTLLRAASPSCRSADNLLPSIQRLYKKAYESVNPSQYQASASPSDPSITLAELEQLSGKTHLINASTPMYLPAPSSHHSTRSPRSETPNASNTPVTSGSAIKVESLHPVLAQDLKDYSRGQYPSLQTFTDGSRTSSPAESSTATASSRNNSSRGPYPHPHTPSPAHTSGTAPSRQEADGYYPPPSSYQREGHGGGQYAPSPMYNQQQYQPHQHSHGQFTQRPPHLQQPHPASRYDAGTSHSHTERKFSTLSPPTIPGFDPTIEMLDASWQTLVEQLGY